MTDIQVYDYDAGALNEASARLGESVAQVIEWLIEDDLDDLVDGMGYPILKRSSDKLIKRVKNIIECCEEAGNNDIAKLVAYEHIQRIIKGEDE